jgi:hypothetical protein
MTMPEIRNHYCPTCKRDLSSSEINLAGIHKECKTKVQWTKLTIVEERVYAKA